MNKIEETRRTRRQNAHDASVRSDIHSITDFLRSLFGQRLVAYMAGVKDEKRVGKWARGEAPNQHAQERLRSAYRVAWLLLDDGNTDEVVRAWFIGLNPQLDDVAPATAIQSDQFRDVLTAAEAFIAGG